MAPPRRAPALLGALLCIPLAGAVSACGSSNSQLEVGVAAQDTGQVKPGDLPSYTVSITNDGPGQAGGVVVRVDMPSGFRYQVTTAISGEGTARTQPNDPMANTSSPQWGEWTLTPPARNADGSVRKAHLDITFSAHADGAPGRYDLTPHAFSDDGEVVGKPFAFDLGSAASLSLVVANETSTARPGATVTYRVTVLNEGSGAADSINLLITLPSSLAFSKTRALQGNFSRSSPVDPVAGSLVVYYGGFTIPPRSAAGPGRLTIFFEAVVSPGAFGGRYPVAAQLTNATTGEVVSRDNLAPLSVIAPTPTPVPSPSPTPSPHH